MKKEYQATNYESDLTDKQWEAIKEFFPSGNKSKYHKRSLVEAVLYIVKTGCQWRMLPHDYPPHDTVWSFYRRARENGVWDKMMKHLVKITRKQAGRNEEPSCALIDSQSVKTTCYGENHQRNAPAVPDHGENIAAHRVRPEEKFPRRRFIAVRKVEIGRIVRQEHLAEQAAEHDERQNGGRKNRLAAVPRRAAYRCCGRLRPDADQTKAVVCHFEVTSRSAGRRRGSSRAFMACASRLHAMTAAPESRHSTISRL